MPTIDTIEERLVKRRSGAHAEEAALRALASGDGSVAARRHVQGCSICRDQVLVLSELGAAPAGECPSADVIARVATDADGIGDSATSRHIAACSSCARELFALARLDALPAPPTSITWLNRVRSLVSFEMPLHLAVHVRRAGVPSIPVYDRAMRAYREGDYARALDHLEGLASTSGAVPAVNFFRGACLMQQGRPADAVTAFAEAVRGRPRLTEYRWYLGQALLAAARVEDARVALSRVARSEGPFRGSAEDCLRRLRELGRDSQAPASKQSKKKDRVPTRARRTGEKA